MQTNSPPKLDTSTIFIFSPFKTISTPPKQNKQDSHISSIFASFCYVLTKTTQSEVRQKTYAIENKR